MSEEAERNEHVENIRARLNSFLCGYCGGWFTPKEKRPYTSTAETRDCACPSHIHATNEPDVNDEDVEWLLGEVDRQRVENDRLREMLAAFLEAPVLAWDNCGWSADAPGVLRLELRDGKRLRTAEIPLAKADVITAAAKAARSAR